MGLFSKKPPCPICGGKVSWLLPTKIEGEAVCDDCAGKMDIQDEIKDQMTMLEARDYMTWYNENQVLKDNFIISQKIDFGMLDTKIIFDFENKLFCMSKQPDKTIFEGIQLKSFTVKEDNALLFEGSAAGLKQYISTVPERVMALAPQITQFMINKRLTQAIERMDDDDDDRRSTYHPGVDIPEPFQEFNVELHLEHPYWKNIKCDMSGPVFSSSYPDIDDYLQDYQRNIESVEQLVRAFMLVAFPDAKEIAADSIRQAAQNQQSVQQTGDPIEEIKKYKSLMEQGVINADEFNAKKKQLLGI